VVPYRNVAVARDNESLAFYKFRADDNDPLEDYIKLIQAPGAIRQISSTRVAGWPYEHWFAILSSRMAIVNYRSRQRLRELIAIFVVDEANMIVDSNRDRIVNELVESAPFMNMPLSLITGNTYYGHWQILTMRCGH
jgi:hypothetical protein